MTIQKSDVSDKIKQILQSYSYIITTVWSKTLREKARWELHKDDTCCFEKVLEAAPHKTAAV